MKGTVLFVCNGKVHSFRVLVKNELGVCNEIYRFYIG